ncbi:family 10 glycosylhydrolase [Marinilabiliaceae bacterium ANBcel2]|nr:family 10 glycosylhydrolase [Marinilabiliaceae bacterium ANBcel2]
MKKQNLLLPFIAIVLLLTSYTVEANPPKREMRAVWIASVANIDWPTSRELSEKEQKEELIELLDLAKEYNMNSVILQIRPTADAFFPSDLEPWSHWLTGEQCKGVNYDPLQFAIDECRKRALDIHVWLNPYRAEMDTSQNVLCESHPAVTNPKMFVTYGSTKYFNPGLPETRDHVANVVADLTRRYDIDAIHFDDYFYPYPIAGEEFPDSTAFKKYPRGFSSKEKDDWRRDNVNLIIKQLQDTIKSIKPHVEFGISPFGVWRNIEDDPSGSLTTAGVTNYDDLYADILKWQKKGWIDYVTPQLYWHIGMEAADYEILIDWWSRNTYGCHLYIGQGLYRINRDSDVRSWRSSREIRRQMNLNREYPNVDGSMYFSARSLRENPRRLKQRLVNNHYEYLALPPVNNRVEQIQTEPPANATMKWDDDEIHFHWDAAENNKAFIIYKFRKGRASNYENPENIIKITGETHATIENRFRTRPGRYFYMISAISPTNQESVPVHF